jgi:hypothetical protein
MQESEKVLKYFAEKYIWWKTPEEACAWPERVIAQVMNIGEFNDAQELIRVMGNQILVNTLNNAQAGWFNHRSWAYWHYRLELAELEQFPPLPIRAIG